MPQKSSILGLNHHPYQLSHPGNTHLDLNISARDNLSSFTQRVMSAKLLRLKQLQNQLSEAHLQLNELYSENRLLRSLQKRQDVALDRYEGTQAQLPQLVRSHQEEVRVLRTKYKSLKLDYRNATRTLKERETELQNLKEQHAHLLKLSRDRQLGERESLSKQVEELKCTVDSQASTIQVLNRKLLLETKNLKFQLQQEMQRHKATQLDLQQTFLKMDQLQVQLDQAKEKSILPLSTDRLGKIASSSRLAQVHKQPIGLALNQNFMQVYKPIKPTKERIMHFSANNSNQSSGQPDSSPATYSEKATDLSTSLDSSPEHKANENKTSIFDPSLQQSDTLRLQKKIMQKNAIDFDIPFGPSKDSKIPESSGFVETNNLSHEVLEKEYENAVAMLTELSTKQKRTFEDDISCSLSSLDMASAKHVAALANATFATSNESQSSSDVKLKLDELSSVFRMSVERDENHSLLTVKCQESVVDKKHSNPSKISLGLENESSSRKLSNHKVENTLEPCQSPKHQKPNTEACGLNSINRSDQQFSGAGGDGEINVSKMEEELETSCKEALLKALKAIDESSNHGSESEGSDIGTKPMSKSTVSQRMFLSSNSSDSGRTVRQQRRRKPFK